MGKIIVEHEIHGKVLFDTETQSYEFIEPSDNTYFNFEGKRELYYKNVTDFLNSDNEQGVVPLTCVATGFKGKRSFCDLVDWENIPLTFFNVEMVDSKWWPNKIDNFIKGISYLVIIRRNKKALNDFTILSSIPIDEAIRRRGDSNLPPLQT